MANKPPKNGESLMKKLYRRELHGTDRWHRKARLQRIFKKIPKRLCYRLSSLVPQIVLEEGHVFLGFTKCGQFVMSYTCHMDASEQTSLPFYMYKLQWWWFVPSKPLMKLHEIQLFGDEDILQDLFILFCEWPEDNSQVLIFGHSLPGRDQESCQCYFTVAAVPSLAPCKPCKDTRTGPGDKSLCLKHGFCFHSKYELTPPFPMFCPRLQLKCDGTVILNTGDSIVALSVQLDSIHTKSKVPSLGDSSSILKNLKSKESLQNSSGDKNKENVCGSPDLGKEFEWEPAAGAGQLPLTCDSTAQDGVNYSIVTYAKNDTNDKIIEFSVMKCVDEDQKENTAACSNAPDISKCKSPKSPKSVLSTNQKSPTQALPTDRWFECRSLTVPTSPNQAHCLTSQTDLSLRLGRAGSSTSGSHVANDLYNFDSDDSEDNSYNFMCPNVPRFSLRSRPSNAPEVIPHSQNLVISPSILVQRQLGHSVNKASPLINSQAFNCLQNLESPRNYENVLSRAVGASQRSFFSPSNSEHSFGGTSSSADSVIVQVNDARTVTHSWRKFSYHGDSEVDSTLVIEDDFDLTYRSVLPAEVRGTKNRQLSLSLEPSDGVSKEQICVRQITFDIEHYMEETIRGRAKWGDRYIAFTNYDLQILDVYSDRNEVLAKVFALISARDENVPRKSRKGYMDSEDSDQPAQLCKGQQRISDSIKRGQEKLYQTSFTFEVNIQSGAYDTLLIEDLTLIDAKDIRFKDWKPGFQECALVRRHTYIPQSSRCVHVLSNESVFKGKSLQMILFPEHYTAIIL